MNPKNLIFHQLFDSVSSTFTYLLADSQSREALIIDPVLECLDRDYKLIQELDLGLKYILETHIHADHITSASLLKSKTNAQIALSKNAHADGADIELEDGAILKFGAYDLECLATPGHTSTCMSFLLLNMVFTGDSLMIRANGRTDFQSGSAQTQYQSIMKLYELPDDCIVYPGHDYKGMTSSRIGDEKKLNPRISVTRKIEDFVQIMNDLKLAKPAKIDIAVPANLKCGKI